jgi:hypothetical protein
LATIIIIKKIEIAEANVRLIDRWIFSALFWTILELFSKAVLTDEIREI